MLAHICTHGTPCFRGIQRHLFHQLDASFVIVVMAVVKFRERMGCDSQFVQLLAQALRFYVLLDSSSAFELSLHAESAPVVVLGIGLCLRAAASVASHP